MLIISTLYVNSFLIAFIFVFDLEGLFLIRFTMQIYRYGDAYLSLKFEGFTKTSSRDSAGDTGVKKCKYDAYKRLYDLMLKKELSFSQIILTLTITFLNTPINIFKTFVTFIKSQHDLHDFINSQYAQAHFNIKELNIEILNGKVHLNRNTEYEKKKNEIIEIDPSFEFTFVEDKEDIEGSPVDGYFMRLDDLSINLIIQHKGIKGGVHFMIKISNALKNPERNGLPLCQILNESVYEKCIQKILNFNIEEKTHTLTIDDRLLDLNKYIQILSLDNRNKNTLIEIKLKINLREYLLISNLHHPCMLKCYPYDL